MERRGSATLDRSASDYSDLSDVEGARDQKTGPHRGDDGEDLIDDTHQADFITGIWGVIYTVSREKKIPWAQVIFRLSLDFLQLLLITINPQYGWTIDGNATWWRVVSFVQLNQFMSERGIVFFLVCFYIFSALLLMTAALCVWVAYAFQRNRFDFVWPVVFLRWFSNIFFQILDIASMTLFFMVMDCQFTNLNPELRNHNQEFPEFVCWDMPFLIHVIVGATAVILFVVMATVFQMGELETDPTNKKNPLAMAHSKVEVQGFLLKFFMTACSVFVTDLKWLAICYTVASAVLVYLYVKWVPHYANWVNIVRAGSYGSVFYSAVVMAVMTWATSIDKDDPSAVSSWRDTCTIALVAGLVPAGLLAAALAYFRLHYLLTRVVNKFRTAPPEHDVHLVHTFSDPREVEICARCLRVWVPAPNGGLMLDFEAVDLAEVIIKVGLIQFKGDAYANILFAGFLVDVRKSGQSSLILISAAKKSRPNVLENFFIFSLEQQQVQTDCNTGSDLLSYVQMQRNLRLATKVYNDSLQAMAGFWQLLLQREVQLEDLIKSVKQVDAMVKTADMAYKELFQSTVESWRILKVYAKYLEVIKMDPFQAAKWEHDAEEMSRSEEEGHADLFKEADSKPGQQSDSSMEKNKAIFHDHRCAIIINSFGIITMANKAAFKLFGCKLSDLMGKNVKILMPSPFKEHHDQFLKNYVQTGRPKAIGRTVEMVAQHYDGHLFSVHLTISKVSGMGMDSNFMGVLEALPESDHARAWLLGDGTVMCIANSITQWFGYENEEIARMSFLDFVLDPQRLDEMLKLATETMMSGQAIANATHTWHLDDIRIRHKYLDDPITCSIDISTGGSDTQRFLLLKIQRTSVYEPVLVAHGSGKIIHACDETAAFIGMPPKQLVAEGSVLSLIPEPFSALHTNLLLRGMEPDPSDIPSHSCRSGLSMSMNVFGPKGTELQPFSVSLKKKLQGADGSTQTVISLTKRTMHEALRERCMAVLVDVRGTVHQVTGGQGKLFGFNPQELLNKPLSSFLDIMASADLQGTSSNGHDFTSRALLELASRSVKQPGDSYRVGVCRPVDGEDIEDDEFLGDIVSHLRAVRKVPAILKAALHCFKQEISELQEEGDNPPSNTTKFFDLGQIPDGVQGKYMIELQMWKADIMTGVLVLDDQGIITNTSVSPLYPADLLFGFSSSSMVKRHINNFLPLYDRPLVDLFDHFAPDLGRHSTGGPKKGGMKDKDNSWFRKGPGVVNQISAIHGTDGQALALNVQAVALKGKRGSIGLIVHLHQPVTSSTIKAFMQPSQKGSGVLATFETLAPPSARASPQAPSLYGIRPRSSQGMINPPVLAPRKQQFHVNRQDSIRLQKAFEALVDVGAGDDYVVKECVIGVADLALPASLNDSDDKVSPFDSASTTHEDSAHLAQPHTSQPLGSSQPPTAKDKDKVPVRVTNEPNIRPHSAHRKSDSAWLPPDPPVEILAHKMHDLKDLSGTDDDDWVSDGGTATSGNAADSGIGAVHYKRGRRLKRLLRLLTGAAALQVINRFTIKAAAVAVFVCIVTVACFTAAYVLIKQQSAKVLSIQNMGYGATALGKFPVYINNLILIFSNNTAPWLDNLKSFDDIHFHLYRLDLHLHTFTTLHRETFSVMQGLPQSGSPALERLYQLWHKPVLPITTILPSSPTNAVQVTNASLWDAGQYVINKAKIVLDNTPTFPIGVVNATTFENWYDARFILDNIKDTLVPAYTYCMDNYLEVVLSEANNVNSIHYYFLAVEGCIASFLALLVMLVITTQMVIYRWNIYNIFMMIPTTIIRSIATRVVEMMEDGREGAVELERAAAEMHGPDLPAMDRRNKEMNDENRNHQKPTINLASSSYMIVQETTVWGILKSTCISLKCWGKRKRVSPLSGKRTLVRSLRLVAWFLLPFALWGLMMIVINVTAHAQLALVQSPIALFTLINYNVVEFYRRHVVLQSLATERDPRNMPQLRLQIADKLTIMQSDYVAMLYGAAAVVDDSPHIRHVKNGIISTSIGKQILYQTTDCLRLNQSTCLPPNNRFYGATRTGLDAMYNRYFECMNIDITSGGLATVYTTEFDYVFTAYWDISGGLVELGDSYYAFVESVYAGVMTTHIAGLVVTLILMAGFAFFMLWPYVKTCKAEGRRIADLLNQLPTDIDVEALVRKAAISGGSSACGSLRQPSK